MQEFGALAMKQTLSQSGFTLIEVIVAMAVLTIGILGASVMQIQSINGNGFAYRLSTAVHWGGDTMETLMAKAYDDPLLVDTSNAGANAGTTGLDNTDAVGSLADGGPVTRENYTIFWNVADDYPVFGTKTIRVIVRRVEQGQQRIVSHDFIKMEPI